MNQKYILARDKINSFCYKQFAKPLFFISDPEKVHRRMMKTGNAFGKNSFTRFVIKKLFYYQNPILGQKIAGIEFKNPIGLAAGFDKDGELVEILPKVGFGFEEIGSVTGKPCTGNPSPRLWRLPKAKSLVVWYGLKNKGAEEIAEKLQTLQARGFQFPIGVSAAKTNCAETAQLDLGIEDYLQVLRAFRKIGDYYTINISCPNSFGGQDFQDAARLRKLFIAIEQEKLFCKPVFLKISPELSKRELDEIISLCLEFSITGIICSNLIKQKKNATLTRDEEVIWQKGGISGKPVQKFALEQVKYIYTKTKGKLIIIGCGGIFSAEDAYQYICNGASLLQLITGMIYEGPQVISSINQGLVRLLQRDGFKNIFEAIGKDVQ